MANFRTLIPLLVTLSASALLAAEPARPGQPPVDSRWYLVGNHLHTSTGGDHSWHNGLKTLLENCDKLGLDFAIVTDHNSIDHWFFPEWKTVGKTTPIHGEEWTTPDGHAGLVAYEARDGKGVILPCTRPDSGITCVNGGPNYQDMVQTVHKRGGMVIINHPKLIRHTWPDETFGADFVDVAWNLSDPVGSRGRKWWHTQMMRGVKVGCIGGSDWHYTFGPHEKGPAPTPLSCGDGDQVAQVNPEQGDSRIPMVPQIDKPVNLVNALDKSADGVIAALRKNHLIVLKNVGAARAFIGADVNGDGIFDDAREGDTVNAPVGTEIHFQARVMGGKGQTLHIIDRKSDTEVAVTSDDFVTAFTRTRSDDGSFVRLELGGTGECTGNPIHY